MLEWPRERENGDFEHVIDHSSSLFPVCPLRRSPLADLAKMLLGDVSYNTLQENCVKQGSLMKTGANGKGWKTRLFVLQV